MNEKTRKAFELTCYEILPKEVARRIASANGKYNNPQTLQIFDFFEAGTEHQQKRMDKLETLLNVANCPCCDGSGAYHNNYGEPLQCQWCYERDQVLKEKNNDSN